MVTNLEDVRMRTKNRCSSPNQFNQTIPACCRTAVSGFLTRQISTISVFFNSKLRSGSDNIRATISVSFFPPRSCYLLKRTLGFDAFPSYKNPVIPEAQTIHGRAAHISNQLLGFFVEPTNRKKTLWGSKQDGRSCQSISVDWGKYSRKEAFLLCCGVVKRCHHYDGPLFDLLQECNKRSHICTSVRMFNTTQVCFKWLNAKDIGHAHLLPTCQKKPSWELPLFFLERERNSSVNKNKQTCLCWI